MGDHGYPYPMILLAKNVPIDIYDQRFCEFERDLLHNSENGDVFVRKVREGDTHKTLKSDFRDAITRYLKENGFHPAIRAAIEVSGWFGSKKFFSDVGVYQNQNHNREDKRPHCVIEVEV